MGKIQSAIDTLKNRGTCSFTSAVLHLTAANINKKIFGKRFVKRHVNNYKMLLDTEDRGISRSLILFGTREVDHKIILEDVVMPGMRIFDIGANIGYYVLMESKIMQGHGQIIAIEPSPANTNLLNQNIELNGCKTEINIVEGAVSDKEGEFDFYLAEQSNLNTFHKEGSAASHLSGETIKVKTYTIPTLVAKYGAPDFIRMDVEGHELEIIAGMLTDIKANKYKPMICFEPHLSCYTKEHDFAPILAELFKSGYKTSYLSSNADSGTERIMKYGYLPVRKIKSDGEIKAIFKNIKPQDTIDILTKTGGARTVLLCAE